VQDIFTVRLRLVLPRGGYEHERRFGSKDGSWFAIRLVLLMETQNTVKLAHVPRNNLSPPEMVAASSAPTPEPLTLVGRQAIFL